MLNVTFVLADDHVITVPAQPGQSLMEAALIGGVPGIVANCGGGAICGTCHVYVDAGWSDRIGSPEDAEDEILDAVHDPGPLSRLSCQVLLREEFHGLVVRVPIRQNT
ncbi:2Fe-2S iron-sulfur cluster-binding protein [Hyphomicrobium sp. CS1GBMeth3]|uniref:2Fe-2S iron-sulfur cluster-binding protein n=1 Tax=Hyphomicrobium sp. CS1GBMeth3 TaxID=1892845 RepID=UPI000930C8D2|nr:2Fe-2S iron-sulfur cluster-binding protein [Hyphomicrobium sp. CS1GBMeth3]